MEGKDGGREGRKVVQSWAPIISYKFTPLDLEAYI
jgi:hypothetical protein